MPSSARKRPGKESSRDVKSTRSMVATKRAKRAGVSIASKRPLSMSATLSHNGFCLLHVVGSQQDRLAGAAQLPDEAAKLTCGTGSMPMVGSSKSSTLASAMSPRARCKRCFMPRE